MTDGYFVAAEAGELELTDALDIIAEAVTSTAQRLVRSSATRSA